jgi:hypothetical protein
MTTFLLSHDLPNWGAAILTVVGALLGVFFDRASRKISEHNKVRKWYGDLAGDYLNYRIKEDGTEEPTDGTIRLAQKSGPLFIGKGLHRGGDVDWESEIRLNLEIQNLGTGYYLHHGKPQRDYGEQHIRYFPDGRFLQVVGRNTSHGKTDFFRHCWRRKA